MVFKYDRLFCWLSGLWVVMSLGACTVVPPVDPGKEPEKAPPSAVVCPEPPLAVVCPAVKPENDAAFATLLDDLVKYPALKREEARRLQTSLEEAVRGSDEKGNRLRLAVLWTQQKTQQGDQKALTLLDQVIKSKEATTAQRHLAGILQMQIQERQAVRQKLDALLEVDRKILGERLPGAKVGKPSSQPATKTP